MIGAFLLAWDWHARLIASCGAASAICELDAATYAGARACHDAWLGFHDEARRLARQVAPLAGNPDGYGWRATEFGREIEARILAAGAL